MGWACRPREPWRYGDPAAYGLEATAITAALGGWASNLTTDFFKILSRPVAEKFLAGHPGIDENHDVSLALRLAQLTASRAVFGRFAGVIAKDPDPEARLAVARFSEGLERFLATATAAAERGKVDEGRLLDPDEQAVRTKVLAALPDGFDDGLAARRATGEQAALLTSLEMARCAVEAAVMAEICQRVPVLPQDVPLLFRSMFAGSRFADGWFGLFIRDAAARVKQGADFERIWNAEQIALLKAIAEASAAVLNRVDAGVARIDTRTASMDARLDELLAIARTGGAFQRAAAQGIPEAAVRAIVERLGGEGIAATT